MGLICNNNRGVALILTILIISVLVSLTFSFNISMRSELYAAANLQDRIMLAYTAKSGFHFGLAILFDDIHAEDAEKVDSLHDLWASTEAVSASATALFNHAAVYLKIADLSSKIQINNLVDKETQTFNEPYRKVMTRFLASSEFDLEPDHIQDIIESLKDWIDNDDEVTGLGGAEDSFYQGLETPYECRNAPLKTIEELLLIKGISQELLYGNNEKPGIAPYLSVHGDGPININTADPFILRALSSDIIQDMVDDLVAYRAEKDNDLSGKWYNDVIGNIEIDIPLVTQSNIFHIESEAVKDVMRKKVTGVVKRKDTAIRILSWVTME